MTGPALDSLPVLDLSRFRADPAERARFLTELRAAARDVGFFYVTGHGVPAQVTSGIDELSRRFFALPVEQRLEIENAHSPQFRGYTRTGTEHTAGSADWREQIDIGPERARVEQGPGDPDWVRLIGPHQWPSALPELRDVVLAWQDEALRVSREVLRALAAALGQDEGYFDTWFGVSDDPDNPLLAQFGENAVVGWLRSHPGVAQRHWSDVLARRA